MCSRYTLNGLTSVAVGTHHWTNSEKYVNVSKNFSPSDNQIRKLLDQVAPHYLSPMFAQVFTDLEATGELDAFRSFDGNLHIALERLCYFSSKKIHCQNCSHKTASNGVTTYFHSAITNDIRALTRYICFESWEQLLDFMLEGLELTVPP